MPNEAKCLIHISSCSFICPCSEAWEDGHVSYRPMRMSMTTLLQPGCLPKNTVATWHTGRTQTPTPSQDDKQRKMDGRGGGGGSLLYTYGGWSSDQGTLGCHTVLFESYDGSERLVLVDTMWVGVALGWGEGLRRETVKLKLKIGWETDRDRLTICVLVAISWGKEEKQKRKERQKRG